MTEVIPPEPPEEVLAAIDLALARTAELERRGIEVELSHGPDGLEIVRRDGAVVRRLSPAELLDLLDG